MPAPPITHYQLAFGARSVVDSEPWAGRFDRISASFCAHDAPARSLRIISEPQGGAGNNSRIIYQRPAE